MEESRNNNPMLNPEEVAEMLDCTPEQAVALARRGELRASKQGRVWRYHPEDVAAYQHREGGPKDESKSKSKQSLTGLDTLET